jgi:phosphoglycolate phosphatase
VTGRPDGHAVLLDLDGTLTDNYPGISASIVHALVSLGEPVPSEQVLRACVGPPLRGSLARLLGTEAPDRVDLALARYRERFADVGWRENAVYPGIVEALRDLGASAPLFVCTTKPEVFARRVVTHFGLDAHLREVYGPGLDGRHDDKAELLAHLVEQQSLDPARCVMVGDRVNDVRAARAVGTAAIGVLWGYGGIDELREADALIASPGELPAAARRFLRPSA